MIRYILIALLVLAGSSFATVRSEDVSHGKIDSLRCLLSSLPQDKHRLEVLYSMTLGFSNTDSVIKYSDLLVKLSRKLNKSDYELFGLRKLGENLYYSGEYQQSLEYFFSGLMITDSLNDDKGRLALLRHIANSCSMLGYDKTLDYYRESLELAESLNDTSAVMGILLAMAQEFVDVGMLDDAEAYYKRVISEYSTLCTRNDSSCIYWGLGYLELCRSSLDFDENNAEERVAHLDASRTNLLKAYAISDCSMIREYSSLAYLSDLYTRLARDAKLLHQTPDELLDSCYMFIQRGLAITRANDFENGNFVLTMNLVPYYNYKGEYDKSIHLLDSLDVLYHTDEMSSEYMTLSQGYAEVYDSLRNYRMCNKYLRNILSFYRNRENSDYGAKASRVVAEAKYERSLKQHEVEREIASVSARWRLCVIVLLAVSLVYFIYSLFRSRMKNVQLNEQNLLLEEQHEEIMVQNESLEAQKSVIEAQKLHLETQNGLITKANNDMVSSLNYACLIQRAVMPDEEQMRSMFPDSMVYFKPLNIVSGDFFWCAKVDGCKILAVGDCTGHGVPGGFLSMLGMSLLNDITADMSGADIAAGGILDRLDAKFQQALRHSGSNGASHDGMDIAVVVFDPEARRLHYAGAFRPLLIVGTDGLRKVKADRWSIGSSDGSGQFTDNIVEYSAGDALYLYSDGVTDQFGYDGGREVKFGSQRLESLVDGVWRLPMSSQYSRFEYTMDRWRANMAGDRCEQLDDTLMVAVRLG